jgi:uncharacterized protein YeaO (DUF488 family)
MIDSMIILKRAYAPPDPSDGTRVLVDRLWPRGLKREDAKVDEWAKDVAPSTELRLWYGHRPELWPEFEVRYRRELARPDLTAPLERLRVLGRAGALTLLTATRSELNHAVVLRQVLLHPPRA